MSQDVNQIIDSIIEGFHNKQPKRTVTRRWRDRAAYENEQLKAGNLTVVYTGEQPLGDVYNTKINLLVIGRVYCGADANGFEIEQAELKFLREWRDFTSSAAFGNISIQKVMTSQQQEAPDGWFICECIAGPYDLGPGIDWLPEGPSEVPEKIMVSQSPDIGFGHEDDYTPISDLLENDE